MFSVNLLGSISGLCVAISSCRSVFHIFMSFATKFQAKIISNCNNIQSNPNITPRPLIKMALTACPELGEGRKIIFCPNFIKFDHLQPILKEKTANKCNVYNSSKMAPWPPTGCPSAKADVSIGPDKKKYVVQCQSSKISWS